MDVDVWSHDEPQDGSMEALLPGSLDISEGHAGIRCGDDVEVVRWPCGTTWDSSSDELVSPEGKRFKSGEHLRLGGGYVPNHVLGPPSTRHAQTIFDMGDSAVE